MFSIIVVQSLQFGIRNVQLFVQMNVYLGMNLTFVFVKRPFLIESFGTYVTNQGFYTWNKMKGLHDLGKEIVSFCEEKLQL